RRRRPASSGPDVNNGRRPAPTRAGHATGQRSLRAWQRQGGEPTLLEALQHRRRLRTGIVQALYLLAGVALGGLLPSVAAGPTIESATVAPMLFGAAGGFISFIALVFSLLFLVVQYGNTSVSPRLTIFRDDPIVWHTFGFFT